MTDAVVVENLSKRFQIGAMAHETMLREKIMSLFSGVLGRRTDATSREFWALKDVSFRIPEGQVVGIIGRNGAGKSTLLKTLARIMYPTTGRVMTRGRLASLLEVGTGFHEELTGRENIFLNGSILGMKRSEVQAQLDNIVQFSEVGQFLDTPIKRYSSGMRLRLGFAVAAHLNPDVLIVDEVLAVGDVGFQRKCLTAMEDLRGGGRTVLFVSHNMAAVENLCSRAIWIDAGQVRMDGPSHEVIERYMATFAEAAGSAADLTGAVGRRGSGEAQYTRVEFFGKDGDGDKLIRSGRGMRIRMHYHVKKPIAHASLGFALRTDMGTLITETSTSHHGIDIPLLPEGDGYIELEIDFLNLLPARYYFSLGLSGGMHHHVYDFVENAAYIDVEPSNIYNCNRVIDSRCGIAYFPQRWNFEGTRAEFHLP